MGPNAYQLLEKFGLPHPAVLSRKDVMTIGHALHVYVRGPRLVPEFNRRVSVETLRRDMKGPQYSSAQVTFEESPTVTHGGAAYKMRDGAIYAELCYGHTSGLLRHGFCAGRHFQASPIDKPVLVAEDQKESIFQRDGGDTVAKVDELNIKQIWEILGHVASNLFSAFASYGSHADMLCEWIRSEESQIQYVDMKALSPSSLRTNFAQIGINRPLVIEDTLLDREPTRTYSGRFAEQFENIHSAEPYEANVKEQALLSHFFVYSRAVPRRINLIDSR